MHAHVDRCHAIALRVLGNPHDAEEVAQDALVRAYRALAGLRRRRGSGSSGSAPGSRRSSSTCAGTASGAACRPTTPLAPLVEAGAEPAADAVRRTRRRWPRAADERERLGGAARRAPGALPRYPSSFATSTTSRTPSWPLVLGRPEGTLKAQVHRGLALLRVAAAGTGLEELTA